TYGQSCLAREDLKSQPRKRRIRRLRHAGAAPPGADRGARSMRQGAPRRRRWPVFVPLALVVALAILCSAFWFFSPSAAPPRLGAPAAEATTSGWREREAKVGLIYNCDKQTIGGFPFRFELRCADPSIELRRDDPPVALKAADLVVVSQVYQPTLLISEFSGPM